MNDLFLRACRREPVPRTPVWFMRQAGRYMPEYRALRERHSLLTLCRTPELAVEVTLQPVRALGVDAAILFSDILLPLDPMGIPFDFQAGEGPVIERPLRSRADIDRLRAFEPREELGMVLDAIRLLRAALEVPLIGFAGAPFTLASYAIEGGHSSQFALTKRLMYEDPAAWHALASLLAKVVGEYLVAQVEAGAQAVQLFDSWVGALDEADYREFVLPHTRAHLRAPARPRRAHHPLRHRHRAPAGRPARGGRRRHRRGLAHATRRGLVARRGRGRPGEPGPDGRSSLPVSGCWRAWTTCCGERRGAPGTSSTSATGSCPAPRSTTSAPSSITCGRARQRHERGHPSRPRNAGIAGPDAGVPRPGARAAGRRPPS